MPALLITLITLIIFCICLIISNKNLIEELEKYKDAYFEECQCYFEAIEIIKSLREGEEDED